MLKHLFGRWWIIGWYITKITPIKHHMLKNAIQWDCFEIPDCIVKNLRKGNKKC
jgi:hypothetical protein